MFADIARVYLLFFAPRTARTNSRPDRSLCFSVIQFKSTKDDLVVTMRTYILLLCAQFRNLIPVVCAIGLRRNSRPNLGRDFHRSNNFLLALYGLKDFPIDFAFDEDNFVVQHV